MPLSIHGTNGITFNDGSTQTTRPAVGFRNRIINGDMRIDQRNAGASVTLNTGSPSYTLDRWFAYQNSPSTGVAISRNSSAPSGFQNSIKWGRNGSGTAGGVTVLGQAIETSNSLDMQGNKVTLSFYAKAGANFSAASSQLGVTLYSGTGTDESVGSMITNAWTGSATPISSTATLTTSWQRFTFTSTTLGASVSQLGIYLSWTTVGTAGADDNIYITGVQLEAGPTATDFERRPIGTELALCQRYFSRTDAYTFVSSSSSTVIGAIPFPVEMRANPTIDSTGVLKISDSVASDFTQTSKSITINNTSRVSKTSVLASAGNFSGLTTYRVYNNIPNETSYITFSAEL